MRIKIQNIATSPIFISAVITLIIFTSINQNFKEFSVVKISEETKDFDEYRFFYDINNDSIDENVNIEFFKNLNSKGLIVRNDDGKILNTSIVYPYNLPSFYAEPFKTKSFQDSVKNMMYVIERGNSIYLGTNRMDTLLEQIFLDTIYSEGEFAGVPKAYDYGYFGMHDANGDNFPELYLYIAEGYRIFPRRLYCVDYKHNKVLFKSKMFGAFPVNYQKVVFDKEPYFVVGSQATSNMQMFPDFYLCDTASYFMVFDKNLELKFEPIRLGGNSSRVYFFPKKIENKNYFFVLSNPYDESKQTEILQINLDGKIAKKTMLSKTLKATFGGIFSIENEILFLNSDGKYQKINVLTQTETHIKLNFAEKPFFLKSHDIDNDGKAEHFFRDKSSNKIYITRNKFEKPAKFELPLNEIDYARFYFPRKKDKKNQIFVWTYTKYYTFEYVRDKFYFLKLLGFIAGLFVTAYLFVFLISYLQKYRLQQKAKTTARIKELEFYNVRNQMNPHFTLNTLNFISTSVLKNEKEKAYDVISGFSNIIRATLLDANKILRTLQEELDFVNDYLKIQKARFGDKFDFFINLENVEPEKIKVPPFIIQIFVENSLKHGLKNVSKGGKIEIEAKNFGKYVEITISDNGEGRKNAKSLPKTSTGKGLKITQEYIKLINSLNKEKIRLEFFDKQKGFTVKVSIPVKLKNK